MIQNLSGFKSRSSNRSLIKDNDSEHSIISRGLHCVLGITLGTKKSTYTGSVGYCKAVGSRMKLISRGRNRVSQGAGGGLVNGNNFKNFKQIQSNNRKTELLGILNSKIIFIGVLGS